MKREYIKGFTIKLFEEDSRTVSNHTQFRYNKNADKMSIVSIFMCDGYFTRTGLIRMNHLNKKREKSKFEIKVREIMEKKPNVQVKEIASKLKCNISKVANVYMKVRRRFTRKKNKEVKE